MPHRLAKMLLILLVTPGCKATPGAPERPEVVDYLMPRGRDKIELLMERKVWGPGRDLLRQPRMLLAERSGEGVIYSLGERVDHDRWRTSARLFFVATSRGACIKRQEDLAGQPVGVEEPRLVIPWPLRPGVVRHLEYRLLGPQEDGSKTAAGKVTVLRSGFHEKVAGKSYG
ncbi:MAG: hypothetical protein RBU30_16145, partial [Polyangia bacterium]|nr:hypothetical protein [Polyangia bacterium]